MSTVIASAGEWPVEEEISLDQQLMDLFDFRGDLGDLDIKFLRGQIRGLVEAGADPNVRTEHHVYKDAPHQFQVIAEYGLAAAFDDGRGGYRPLDAAILANRSVNTADVALLIEELLNLGADPNMVGAKGETPLQRVGPDRGEITDILKKVTGWRRDDIEDQDCIMQVAVQQGNPGAEGEMSLIGEFNFQSQILTMTPRLPAVPAAVDTASVSVEFDFTALHAPEIAKAAEALKLMGGRDYTETWPVPS